MFARSRVSNLNNGLVPLRTVVVKYAIGCLSAVHFREQKRHEGCRLSIESAVGAPVSPVEQAN